MGRRLHLCRLQHVPGGDVLDRIRFKLEVTRGCQCGIAALSVSLGKACPRPRLGLRQSEGVVLVRALSCGREALLKRIIKAGC